MVDFCAKETVDLLILSEINTHWNTKNIQIMENKFRSVGQRLKVFTSDSNINLNMNSDFLPGGTLTMIWGRLRNFILPDSYYSYPYRYFNLSKYMGKIK